MSTKADVIVLSWLCIIAFMVEGASTRTVFFRIAGACPPRYEVGRSWPVSRGPVPRERWIARGMARGTRSPARVASEGPSPTVISTVFFIVARGPVPRDRWSTRTMARDRPSPYDERDVFFPRGSDRPRHGEGQALALRCGMPFFL